jgi:hypothetical protein
MLKGVCVRKRGGIVTNTISCASLLSGSPRAVSSAHVAAETHRRGDSELGPAYVNPFSSCVDFSLLRRQTPGNVMKCL